MSLLNNIVNEVFVNIPRRRKRKRLKAKALKLECCLEAAIAEQRVRLQVYNAGHTVFSSEREALAYASGRIASLKRALIQTREEVAKL